MLSFMTSFMMTTKWATEQSAIRTWPCMNIVIFTHNLGNWLLIVIHTGVVSDNHNCVVLGGLDVYNRQLVIADSIHQH